MIRNLERSPCVLSGRVSVEPLDVAGQIIATSAHWRRSLPVRYLTLPARGSKVRAWVALGGEYRDDPNGPRGLCRARDEVVPYYWKVRIAGSAFVVRNDPFGIEACHGHFGDIGIERITV